ncbi:hypothetical protein [Acetonema longum]|uniref:Uncharacterized protein n=1 Tax=Acetonema longum DSM 6540 TaxID=1009370 RepID=F7NEU5_9FIRM|nr:hypothetical protein [Acetonema longum]EGO65506.1 hypothetical protein ALO_02811 [Acetonema longum DSM 6540]
MAAWKQKEAKKNFLCFPEYNSLQVTVAFHGGIRQNRNKTLANEMAGENPTKDKGRY